MFIQGEFEKLVLEFRRLALLELVRELIFVLKRHYEFQEVLGALSEYCEEFVDHRAAEHIQAARLVVLENSSRRGREGDSDDQIG